MSTCTKQRMPVDVVLMACFQAEAQQLGSTQLSVVALPEYWAYTLMSGMSDENACADLS